MIYQVWKIAFFFFFLGLIVATIMWNIIAFLSFGVGGLLILGVFRLDIAMINAIIERRPVHIKVILGILFAGKFFLLIWILYNAMKSLQLNPLWLGAGVSILPAAITLFGLKLYLSKTENP